MYTKNFSIQEMACKCGECDPAEHIMNTWYMTRLQKIRELIAQPLIITSGYRCESHNASVGGSRGSFHLLGRAADIRAENGRMRSELVMYAFKAGCYGIGIGADFIHIDDRPFGKMAMWHYY